MSGGLTVLRRSASPGNGNRPLDRPRVVIILENVPVERDRRVTRQAQALLSAGIDVTVICPAGPSDRTGRGLRPVRIAGGVEVRPFQPARERGGIAGFVWEYVLALVQIARLLARVRREHSISGIQVCNPPDIFFPIGWWARRNGIPFVFDQHDLCPELFLTRFGTGAGGGEQGGPPTGGRTVLFRLLHRALLRCERETYRAATRVIATNESYRRVAMSRGSVAGDEVAVVRNGPDPDRMRRRPGARRPGFANLPHLVVWMGNMGPQDGVDDAVRAVAHLVHRIGRTDTGFVFIGTGEVLADVRNLATQLDVADHITFTGWIPDDEAFAWLSSADVGLSADPPGPLNDHSTMIKTLEYMAFGLPVVAHDLHETRVSLGDAGVFAATGDPAGLATRLDELLDDPGLRDRLGREGRRRIETRLSWPHQAHVYVDLWSSLVGSRRPFLIPFPESGDGTSTAAPARSVDRPQPLTAGEAAP